MLLTNGGNDNTTTKHYGAINDDLNGKETNEPKKRFQLFKAKIGYTKFDQVESDDEETTLGGKTTSNEDNIVDFFSL
ncbi:unnamed protein product, partial [Didymodactylos carnosus]